MNMGYGDASAGGARQGLWIRAMGRHGSVAQNTSEDVWDGGGDYGYLSSASVLEVVSGSPNDAAAGTGARTIRVFGLDENWDFKTQDVTLNGTNAVDLSGTWLRVWRIRLLTAGSGGIAAGTLTLRVDGGGATVGQLQTLRTTSYMAMFTVPRKHSLYLTEWEGGFSDTTLTASGVPIDSQGVIQLQVRYKDGNFAADDEFMVVALKPYGQRRQFPTPLVIPAQADVKLRVVMNSTTTTAGFRGSFQGYLLPSS